LGLLALAALLFVMDYSSTEFAVDSIQLGFILGASLLLLAVEGGKFFLRR